MVYTLDILISVAFVLGAGYFGYLALQKGLSDEMTLKKYVIIATVLLCFEAPMHMIRMKARQIIDFDEYGNSLKYQNYDKLSRQDKDEIDRKRLEENERILDSNSLRKMTHEGSRNPEEELNSLIGIENVKDEMLKMAAKMEYEKKGRKNRSAQSLHMCFLGSPGTGKTTVARIACGYLYKYRYIKKNQYIETDGVFLRGMNASDTQQKVTRLVQAAMGGVLFIDEAYALAGFEDAVSVLIKAMEDNRDRLVVIFAGYKREMSGFIQMNSGIFSRIKTFLTFEDYTNDELYEIFKSMAKTEGFIIDAEAKVPFMVRMNLEKQGEFFGNARTVRNVLEHSIDNHYLNLKKKILGKDKRNIICKEDIDQQPDYVLEPYYK